MERTTSNGTLKVITFSISNLLLEREDIWTEMDLEVVQGMDPIDTSMIAEDRILPLVTMVLLVEIVAEQTRTRCWRVEIEVERTVEVETTIAAANEER